MSAADKMLPLHTVPRRIQEAAFTYADGGYVLAAWLRTKGKGPKDEDDKGWGLHAFPPAQVTERYNIGMNHALSRTAVLDVDDVARTTEVLEFLGLDLDELIASTMSWRGNPSRIKLAFRAPEPMRQVKKLTVWLRADDADAHTVLELRGAADGKQAQDVLPPSIHPDTGKPYEFETWFRPWNELPEMPTSLVQVWSDWDRFKPILRRLLGDVKLPAEQAQRPARQPRDHKGPSVIEAFNARYTAGEILERNGCEKRGKRWLRPNSSTGQAGIVQFPDGAIYAHGGGILADEKPHDAFDLFRILECNEDISRATRAAAELLGMQRAASKAAESTSASAIETPPPREVIQLEPGQLHNYAAAAERLLAPEIYNRGQQLVRIGKAPELQAGQPESLRRDDSQAVVVPAGFEFLRRRLTELADFRAYRRREKDWVPVDCPKDLASNIAAAGDWPRFKRLDSIATAPFLRPDHTLCAVPGYDDASKVFLAPNASFPTICTNPTKHDALQALQELAEPFSEFPFASDEARVAFLSHLLTSAARHAIDVAPVYSYTAPLPGTGKSLLAGMAARIETGAPAPLRPYAEDSDELRKTLLAALLAGDTTLILDNVPNGQRVRSPTLCGFVTAAVYADRRLGVSEAPRLPNRCTVVMTGNNITAAGDLARRCIIVRLDANAESTRGRDFKIADLGRHVLANRPRLLAAALTVIRAYLAAGHPGTFRPLPSFEQWSRLARDPLIWLGCADPVDTQEQEADDELGPLRAAFAALHSMPLFARAEFTARQLAQMCVGYGEDSKTLREAIEAAGCSDASSAVKVGYWLRANRDRVAGELKLRSRIAGQGIARWKIEPV